MVETYVRLLLLSALSTFMVVSAHYKSLFIIIICVSVCMYVCVCAARACVWCVCVFANHTGARRYTKSH